MSGQSPTTDPILRRAFPFLLKVDRDGRLREVGSMWGQVACDVKVGALIDACFTLDAEDARLLRKGRWRRLEERPLNVRHRTRPVRLQGELHARGEYGLLLISPVFTSARQVSALGLELSDLPASQPISATLQALTSLSRALREHQDLADVLRQERLELERSRTEAEAAARAKARFLAVMSHEIRTPLNGLLGMLDALLDHKMGPVQHNQALVARGVGRDLLALLNNVLDLSRLEAGELEFEETPFDIREMLHAVALVLKPANDVQLRIAVHDDVPKWVRGDAHRLRQVLVNLAGNACKFTEVGEVVIAVDRSLGDRLLIDVRDTGVGVPKEAQDQLFEAFTQADASTTRKYGGSGLGLTITRQLVRGMGGKMQLTSTVGEGTSVRFEINLPEAQAPQGQSVSQVRRFKGHVLVAEDNPVNQMVMCLSLQAMGLTTDLVSDGQAALDALALTSYDVVLMDAHMPRMDGIEATRELRKTWPNLPVIACTASTMPEEVLVYESVGMHDVLPKPFQREELASVLHRWLPTG